MKKYSTDEAIALGLINGPWFGELEGKQSNPVIARIASVFDVNRVDGPYLVLLLDDGGRFPPTGLLKSLVRNKTYSSRSAALLEVSNALQIILTPAREALVAMDRAMLLLSSEFAVELKAQGE